MSNIDENTLQEIIEKTVEQEPEQTQETQKETETEVKNEQENTEEQKPYTKEEIEQLGIEKLDPKRIPQDLIPFYKSMQADYTRKTQRLAEERKKLEDIKKSIEQETRLIDFQAQMEIPTQVIKESLEQAKAELRAENPELNEFDADYNALVVSRAQAIALSKKNQINAKRKLEAAENYLRRVDPDFDKVSQYALYLLENELPYKMVKQIETAKQVGDPLPILQLYEMAKVRMTEAQLDYELSQSKQLQQQQVKPEPPIVEKAGKTPIEEKKRVDISGFGRKSLAEQINTLIELGLV